MPTPAPIGPIVFSEPRAQRIREPENLKEFHSVVHGDLNVKVESMREAEAIMAAWRVIMQKAADEAQAILSEMRRMEISDSTMDRYRGDATESMKTGM